MLEPTIQRYTRTRIMHRAVSVGGIAYLGGIVAHSLSAGIEDQTRQVLGELFSQVEGLGGSRGTVLSCTVFLADLTMKDGMNAAWIDEFDAQDLPARATVEANLGNDILIEVVATAAVQIHE